MNQIELKKLAIKLRSEGRTYSEIKEILNKDIPKSTISYWCKSIKLSEESQNRIKNIVLNNIQTVRQVALVVNKNKRQEYIKVIKDRNGHISLLLQNKDIGKIILAMLYLCEGSKTQSSSLTFGNSDPSVINLFLHFLRFCYHIDERKFRCTLQCRDDQNIEQLEDFWSKTTKIDRSQFYKARVDSRTIGKLSKKPDYKGVCRINYFSAELFIELKQIAEIIFMGS